MPTVQQLNRIYRRIYWRLSIAYSLSLVVALVASLGLLASNPKVATWISEAAQAEYVGDNPLAAPESVRVATPDQPVRQAKAN